MANGLEFYANWGRGFHSNDVRGAVNRDSPVPVLVRGTGKEIGARLQAGTFSLTATYYWLDVGSELRFVGDANYTASRSRYDTGDRIPNAFENAASAGVSAIFKAWSGSIRLRHLGPYPLLEDNSVRDHGRTVVNLRGAWKPGRFELFVELLNVCDSRDKDIAYRYESYSPTVDGAPVDGRLSRVMKPRSLRAGVRYNF
jgi:hypothetical protein